MLGRELVDRQGINLGFQPRNLPVDFLFPSVDWLKTRLKLLHIKSSVLVQFKALIGLKFDPVFLFPEFCQKLAFFGNAVMCPTYERSGLLRIHHVGPKFVPE